MEQSEFEHAQAALERLQEARTAMVNEQFTASSKDDYITVTVDSAGYPVDLEFDPRAFRSPVDSGGLAASVLECWREAREQADQRARAALDAARTAAMGSEQAGLGETLDALGRAILGHDQHGGSHG